MPYIVDGQPVAVADEPQNKDGIMWVPLRALSEALGATVEWDEANRVVHLKHSTAGNVQVTPGEVRTTVNSEEQELQAAPFLEGGDTWVPARFFNMQLRYALNVNLAENLVELTTWNG